MVKASFSGRGEALNGFRVCGHSGYAEAGQDVVCAAVSAMTMYTANLLTDGLGIPCDLTVDEDSVTIALSLKAPSDTGSRVIASFKKELMALAAEYPQNILVKE